MKQGTRRLEFRTAESDRPETALRITFFPPSFSSEAHDTLLHRVVVRIKCRGAWNALGAVSAA